MKPDTGPEPPQRRSRSLTGIADALVECSRQGDVTVEDLLLVLGRRGLGAMLILPSLMILLPLGLVPGVPALAGLTMIFVAGHMVLNRKRLWLPRRLARVRLPARRLQHELARFRPYARRFDRWAEGRLSALARSHVAALLAAVVTIVLSALIVVIGFIPGLPAAFSLPILAFALGLAVENGLLILSGYVMTLLSLGLVLWLVP